jgi:hypothetical protein
VFFILLGEATGHDKKLPYAALTKGQINLELRGLPGTIKLKDPSEMGEASLTTIIEYADRIQFVETASLG